MVPQQADGLAVGDNGTQNCEHCGLHLRRVGHAKDCPLGKYMTALEAYNAKLREYVAQATEDTRALLERLESEATERFKTANPPPPRLSERTERKRP